MRKKNDQPSAVLLARRQTFVDVALELFLEKGFGATSVNEVVRRAGGSLATLYKFFPSKEDLFAAIIAEYLKALFEPLQALGDERRPDIVLKTIGDNYLEVTSTPRALAVFRVMVLESCRLPHLRELFLTQGFSKLKAWFEQFLQQAHDSGALRVDDIPMACSQFFGLLRAPWHMPAACGECVDLSPERKKAIVDSACRAFLRAYAA